MSDLLKLKDKIVGSFTRENWMELGIMTGTADIIEAHPRLLRALFFGDEDYGSSVLEVLHRMAARDLQIGKAISSYLNERLTTPETYISSKPSEKRITFAPSVFQIPEGNVELDLVALMIPFRAEFNSISAHVKAACSDVSLRLLRADDIWEESVIMQDVFNLIFKSRAVIVDFTGRNPNVMYETGIAHTLGKTVIPITQSIEDVPSDMGHHRALKYLGNAEGLVQLRRDLSSRLRVFAA